MAQDPDNTWSTRTWQPVPCPPAPVGARSASSLAGYNGPHPRVKKHYLRVLAAAGSMPCAEGCGNPVLPGEDLHLSHTPDRTEWTGLSHAQCNLSEAGRRGGSMPRVRLSLAAPPAKPAVPFLHTHTEGDGGPLTEIPARLRWTNPALRQTPWLADLLDIPADAAAPLAMTPPHPDATGSYGAEAIQWVSDELGVNLRWWQRLAFVRQLEHDADGKLVWRTIVESGPRRIGKSVRLRSMALWRLDHSDLFGETQLAIHTGKDVAIVREIHRQAWSWATERDGWAVRKGVGQEEVLKGVHRWLVRSQDSTYGYDVCLGMIDEGWAVSPATYTEALEPATLERISPQLLLTSTAHRKATSLMRTKITEALTTDDGETLLMLWAAPPDADVSDPEVWKAASPHWSPDRAKMVAAKYASAYAGEADAQADDPDPLEGFKAQYLCMWRLTERKADRGDAAIEPADWARLEHDVPEAAPDSAAIESWFGDGISVSFAWRLPDGRVVVRSEDAADLSEAADIIRASGLKRRAVLVGESLLDDPSLKGLLLRKASGRAAAAVLELVRLIGEDAFLHDGGELLSKQVLAARTMPGSDGPRMVSTGRFDACKTAVWAANAARKRARVGTPRIVSSSA